MKYLQLIFLLFLSHFAVSQNNISINYCTTCGTPDPIQANDSDLGECSEDDYPNRIQVNCFNPKEMDGYTRQRVRHIFTTSNTDAFTIVGDEKYSSYFSVKLSDQVSNAIIREQRNVNSYTAHLKLVCSNLFTKFDFQRSCLDRGIVSSEEINTYTFNVENPPSLISPGAISVCTGTSVDLLKYINGKLEGANFSDGSDNTLLSSNFSATGKYASPGEYRINLSKYYDNGANGKPGNYVLSFIVKVTGTPEITTQVETKAVCIGEPPINLQTAFVPSDFTGSFSLNGTPITSFDPSKYIEGNYTLMYTVQNTAQCSKSIPVTIQLSNPAIIGNLDFTYSCTNSKSIALNITPAQNFLLNGNVTRAGKWSTTSNIALIKTGSIDSLLPKYLNVGENIITYQYTNQKGCISSKSFSIIGLDTTKVTASSAPQVCLTGGTIDLTTLVPPSQSTGTWAGKGVSGKNFDPKVAGVGTSKVLYSFTNSNNCNSKNIIPVDVLTAVTDFSGSWQDEAICNNTDAFDLNKRINPYPGPGAWTGEGTNNNSFNPQAYGAGKKIVLTYTYTSANGCTGTKKKNLIIGSGPKVEPLEPLTLCRNDKPVVLTANPPSTGKGPFIWNSIIDVKRGFWSGPGTINNKYSEFAFDYPYGIYGDPITNEIIADITDYPQYSFLDSLNPLKAQTGNILYTYLTSSGSGDAYVTCASTGSKAITIIDTLEIQTTGKTDYCVNEPSINLSKIVSVPGGTFAVNGKSLTSSTVVPSIFKTGKNSLLYTYKDKNTGCVSRSNIDITLKQAPTITGFFGDAQICKNSTPVNLYVDISAVPFYGTYSGGPGVTYASFNPALSLRDTNEVLYSVTDPTTQCTSTQIKKYIVKKPENIVLNKTLEVCSNTKTLAIDVNPSPWIKEGSTWKKRGVWTGQRIKAGTIYPSVDSISPTNLSAGDYEYIYTYTNQYNCIAKDTISVIVNDTTKISFGTDTSVCKNGSPIILKTFAKPAGGRFDLEGISLNTFNPAGATLGNNIITYSYIDRNNCISRARKNIFVKPNPQVTGAVDTTVSLCNNQGIYDLSRVVIKPLGGTYKGFFVTDNKINTRAANPNNIITYQANVEGCTAEGKFTLIINRAQENIIAADMTLCKNDTARIMDDLPIFNSSGVRSGLWTGNGIIAGKGKDYDVLNPAIAKVGKDSLRYEFTDLNKCKSYGALQLTINPAPAAKITVNKLKAEWGDALQFFSNAPNAASYLWDFNDGGISYEKDPWHYFYIQDTTTVKLTIATEEGCKTSVISAKGLFKINGVKPIDITDVPSLNYYTTDDSWFVSLYPNPTIENSELFIYAYQAEESNVKIYDSKGILVYNQKYLINSGANKFIIPSRDFTSGLYDVNISTRSANKNFKFIKE